MKKIVCVEAAPFSAFSPTQMERLKSRDDIIVHDCRKRKSEDDPDFQEKMRSAEIIIAGNVVQFTREAFKGLPNLKIIPKLGVGLDMIDIPAATEAKVMICNSPGVNDVAVAEHTFALLLGHLRQVIRCDRGMRQGLWEQTTIIGSEICGKTMGIVGMGAIGRAVARRGVGFEARVVGYDPYWPEEFAGRFGIIRKSLEELLTESDYVCIHCPLMPETRNLIGKKQIEMMKPTAFLVNMARGGIVDDDALFEALTAKRIAGAVLDAFAEEPPTDLPFVALDNVILSPHNGAFSLDAMERMSEKVVDQTFEYLDGKTPTNLRNPEAVK